MSLGDGGMGPFREVGHRESMELTVSDLTAIPFQGIDFVVLGYEISGVIVVCDLRPRVRLKVILKLFEEIVPDLLAGGSIERRVADRKMNA